MFNLFKNILNHKKEVTVKLDTNATLTVTPAAGGVNAVLTETGEMFTRTERAFFSTVDDLVKSLRLTDSEIIRKLAKAF